MKRLKVAVVGTGAVGEHLALALKKAGYPIGCIVSRHLHSAGRLAEKVAAEKAVILGTAWPEGIDLVFVCVPDDAITQTAGVMGGLAYDWSGVCVAHTSGALSSKALDALAVKKATVLSFHPVQTFKKERLVSWEGMYIGLEGEVEAMRIGREVAYALGSVAIELTAEDKVLYHASAVFASNFLVTVVGIAVELLEQISVDRPDALRLLSPLVRNSCENILDTSPEKALTGPASRGDLQTIQKHVDALKAKAPEKYQLYLELTREAVRLNVRDLPGFGKTAEQMYKEIDRLIATG